MAKPIKSRNQIKAQVSVGAVEQAGNARAPPTSPNGKKQPVVFRCFPVVPVEMMEVSKCDTSSVLFFEEKDPSLSDAI